jgi:hypothetical protein
MGARLVRAARESWGDRATWPVTAMTALCLALGFWLRARGFFYDVPALWLDECSWAMMLRELPLSELLIRPPGFMAWSKVMGALFGVTETPLRLLPWLASLGSLVMAPPLARRLFRANPARLLFIAVIALHPAATDLAKEFKPYSVSMALHMGLMLLTLRFVASLRTKDLYFLLGVAVVSTVFAQDVIFSFPGVFSIAGYEALTRDRRKLVPIVVAAGIILAVLGAQYLFIWSQLPKDEAAYWGDKYGVFYSEGAGVSYADWFTGRYGDLAAFPGYQRKYWEGSLVGEVQQDLMNVAESVWITLHLVGIVVMFLRTRFREVALLFVPLVVLVLFNQLGFWPFGVFRTNLFLVANTAGIAAMAFDGPTEQERRFEAIAPAAVLLVIPLLFFEDGWPPTKRALTMISEYPSVLAFLAERAPKPPAERQTLVLARRNCEQWRYFLRYHPKTRHLRARLEAGFEPHCVEPSEELVPALDRLTTSETRPTWLVSTLRMLPNNKQRGLERIEREKAGLHAVSAWVRRPPETKHSKKDSAKRSKKSSAKHSKKGSAKRSKKGSAKRSKKKGSAEGDER